MPGRIAHRQIPSSGPGERSGPGQERWNAAGMPGLPQERCCHDLGLLSRRGPVTHSHKPIKPRKRPLLRWDLHFLRGQETVWAKNARTDHRAHPCLGGPTRARQRHEARRAAIWRPRNVPQLAPVPARRSRSRALCALCWTCFAVMASWAG